MTDEKALEISELIQKKRDIKQSLDYYNKENIKFYVYVNSNEIHMPIPLRITNRYFLQDEIKEFVLNKLKKELEETDIKLKNITCEQ